MNHSRKNAVLLHLKRCAPGDPGATAVRFLDRDRGTLIAEFFVSEPPEVTAEIVEGEEMTTRHLGALTPAATIAEPEMATGAEGSSSDPGEGRRGRRR